MAQLERSITEGLIYGSYDSPRYTQDSPVLPDVWIGYGLAPLKPLELLLTPHDQCSAGEVSRVLRQRLEESRAGTDRSSPNIAYMQSYAAVDLYYDELIRDVLPLTPWWQRYVWEAMRRLAEQPDFNLLERPEVRQRLLRDLQRFEDATDEDGMPPDDLTGSEDEYGEVLPNDLLWMMRIVGSIAWAQAEAAKGTGSRRRKKTGPRPNPEQMIDALIELAADVEPPDEDSQEMVWQVSMNRPVRPAVQRSRLAVKADAARLLFKIRCDKLAWAVVDSGIDARHPAFWRDPGKNDPREDEDYSKWAKYTRVKATYDFTRIRDLLNPTRLDDPKSLPKSVQALLKKGGKEVKQQFRELKDRLLLGRDVDWGLLDPFLRVPHDESYEVPASEHGTHVAGILAGDWPQGDIEGICPDIGVYDLRVLRPKGANDEFAVLAALQFIDFLNGKKDFYAIQGANLSLSIRHDVANYACGRTPVCEECERLVSGGVVVVAAAGNEGYLRYQTATGEAEGYHTVSITDPGNAEKVITVGATHRHQPHTYGVSYFSSRGPTGDGRLKPDLVAPGEKIKAPTPNAAVRRKDGTSMAAPHVSGVAALLMARHTELVGRPAEVKEVLCKTATDLGRERYFQGAGMLDALRALQSV